jgi:outer membrane receptor protein involved in Fe transport
MKKHNFHVTTLWHFTGRRARHSFWLSALVALSLPLTGLYAWADSALDRTAEFNIAPNAKLDDALIQWGVAAGMTVMINTEMVEGKITQGVKGNLRASAALSLLLRNTGLSYTSDGGRIRVVPIAKLVRSVNWEKDSGQGGQNLAPAVSSPEINLGNELGSERQKNIEEVIVTAQKREERLEDVPVPVTALSAQALVDKNQIRLADYAVTVPGITVFPAAQSTTLVSIRGITTGGFTNPTVGFLIDDVPFGGTQGDFVPDLDPGDLARVEVLRGPQGTLYGANSMGGLIKFVTADPTTNALAGRVEAGTNAVHNGAEPGYNFRGSLNVPILDNLAIRASAFTRQDPGYINNPVYHLDGVNEDHVTGAHLAMLWSALDNLSLKLSGLYQRDRADGASYAALPVNGYVGPPLGDLQQDDANRTGWYDTKIQAYSAILKAKMGGVELTSLTGYNSTRNVNSFDYTYALGPVSQLVFGPDISGAPYITGKSVHKVTEEVRLAVPIGTRLQWLIGGFYAHEKAVTLIDSIDASNPATGQIVGAGYVVTGEGATFQERAAFTDLTVQITDEFDIQIGGRESFDALSVNASETSGPVVPVFYGAGTTVVFSSPEAAKTNAFTYLFTPRLKLSPDFMVYARIASGFRPGAGNEPGPGIPPIYHPDRTKNYEIGTKGDFLEHALAIDASVYHIDWKNIQISVEPPSQLTYETNGSAAKSEGAELSIEARPSDRVTLSGWTTYTHAVLTEAFPSGPAYGVPGDRLPYTSRFSGHLAAHWEFPLMANVTGFVGAESTYIGDRQGNFPGKATSPRQDYPTFVRTDLLTGFRYGTWAGNLYLNNIADRRAVISGGLGQFPPYGFVYIQPRTVGISLARNF